MLLLPAQAQIMKSSSTTMKLQVREEPRDSNDVMYIGLGAGVVNTVEDFDKFVPYYAPVFLEIGVLRTLVDFNGNVVPFIGADMAGGVSMARGFHYHAGPFVGLMLGKPAFRLDLRIQPSFEYCALGARQETTYTAYSSPEGGIYGSKLDEKNYFGVLFNFQASVWIRRFGVGVRYIPSYKGLIGHIRLRF